MEVTAEGKCKTCGLTWKTIGGDGKPRDSEVHFILTPGMTVPCANCVDIFTKGQSFA